MCEEETPPTCPPQEPCGDKQSDQPAILIAGAIVIALHVLPTFRSFAWEMSKQEVAQPSASQHATADYHAGDSSLLLR
jgi:hypothetical protein